ncbi:MAG: lysophospholipid acyltransferase family protein [Paracoccaceae bacterium]
MAKQDETATSYVTDVLARGLLGVALLLPYKVRIPFFGWVMTYLVSPVAGYKERINWNLDHVYPDIDAKKRKRILRGAPDNAGRTLIEIYSAKSFIKRVKDLPLKGPGAETLAKAHAENRPVILATGHIGNFDALRGALIGKGYRVGGLYAPMRNAFFNRHYEEAIAEIGKPVFPRGRRGFAELLKFLRSGGMVGIVTDQHVQDGTPISFLGQPASTALSAAQLALKYNAPLVPAYGIRLANGLDFEIITEAPIPPSDALTMTKALNASLEALVDKHPEQWLWMHRRWKPKWVKRQRKRAAAKMRPGPTA